MAIFTAFESASDIQKAVDTWESKFGEGAERIDAMGGVALWHEDLAVWGFFRRPKAARKNLDHHWNPFGRVPYRLRQNMLVEINPQ